MVFDGKSFTDIAVGDTFESRLTITDSHITQGCGLFGDFNPLHSDDEFCKGTRFGERILHGPLTSAAMTAPIGMYFYGTAVAYLEHNCSFHAPVKAGDTLLTQWLISNKIVKEKIESGIAELEGVCTNQHDVVVAKATGKILLKM